MLCHGQHSAHTRIVISFITSNSFLGFSIAWEQPSCQIGIVLMSLNCDGSVLLELALGFLSS
jgi:hypothetical protein